MKNLKEKVKELEEKLRISDDKIKDERAIRHMLTIHCCNLIAEKENKEFKVIHKELSSCINNIIQG